METLLYPMYLSGEEDPQPFLFLATLCAEIEMLCAEEAEYCADMRAVLLIVRVVVLRYWMHEAAVS